MGDDGKLWKIMGNDGKLLPMMETIKHGKLWKMMGNDGNNQTSTLEHLLLFQVSMVSIRRKAIGIACIAHASDPTFHSALPQPQC